LTDKKYNITAGDTSTNDQPREIATTTNGESLYSEVIPTNKRKKSPKSGDVKVDNAYSEQVKSTGPGASTNGDTPLGHGGHGGQGNTKAPPQEELYDQPVSLTQSA
jgi:hypothetical protein